MAEEVLKRPATNIPARHFPDVVLIEIFLKLPVSSLLLLKFVCKHWLGLIKSPNFINLHLNRPIDDSSYNPMIVAHAVRSGNMVLTLISDDGTLTYKDYSTLSADEPKTYIVDLSSLSEGETLDDNLFSTYDVQYLPRKEKLKLKFMSHSMAHSDYGRDRLQLLGPCNGLFCITDTVEAVVFNPATKRCRKVDPAPTTSKERKRARYDFNDLDSVGFCYDLASNDYKVVRFDQQKCRDKRHFRIGIYSLSTDSWRELEQVVPDGGIISKGHRHNLFFNGAFHWLHASSILVFDLSEEGFKWFELAGTYYKSPFVDVSLSVLNESLAFIECRPLHSNDGVGCEIWLMMEYGVSKSWTKLYSISHDVGIRRALSLNAKGEFLVEFKNEELASFNLETKAIKLFEIETWSFKSFNLKTDEVDWFPGLVNAFRYRESFVSLNGCKRKSLVSLKGCKRKK